MSTVDVDRRKYPDWLRIKPVKTVEERVAKLRELKELFMDGVISMNESQVKYKEWLKKR